LLLNTLKKINNMNIVDKMRERMFEVIDENNPYTQADFDKEFYVNETKVNGLTMNFVNLSSNQKPEYATVGSSGFDLRANLDESVVIKPFKRAIIPTGLFFSVPDNLEIQVRPRSGLAAKNGVTVLNTPGTVDADYRGEVKVILINLGEEDFVISHGDRIAQAVVAPVISKSNINLNQVDNIDTDTDRSNGGFGSTGIK
jgi:dUTP pyrophosphatase